MQTIDTNARPPAPPRMNMENIGLMTESSLNIILDQCAEYGGTVKRGELVCSVHGKDGRKILSAAIIATRKRVRWHVRAIPGLITPDPA